MHSPTSPVLPSLSPGPAPPAAAPPDPAPGSPSPSGGWQLPVRWSRDLYAAPAAPTAWPWRGFLARGNLTLLTSQSKSGKTTLLAMLLARLRTGGQLLGQPVAPGKALVVSEESSDLWGQRARRFPVGDDVCLVCRPFPGKPTREQWRALLDGMAELHGRHRFDVVAIDALASFLPGRDENNAGPLLECLAPLQALAAQGPGVFLTHHPSKKESAAGTAARGSGALTGFVDIVLEMRWHPNGGDDRRRRLYGWSRYEETPRQLVIELNADGSDYVCRGPLAEEEYQHGWQVVCDILAGAPSKLTLREVLQDWPVPLPRPNEATLWRWLDRAVAQGQVCRDGAGRKRDPHRYWLPGQEKRWLIENPAYLMAETNRQDARNLELLAKANLADCYRRLADKPPPAER